MKNILSEKKRTVLVRLLKFLSRIIIVLAVIYGIIYLPYQQLLISTAEFRIAENRDINSCLQFASNAANQELANQLKIAEEQKQEITEEMKKKFLEQFRNDAQVNCLVLAGRDYLIQPLKTNNTENQKIENEKESFSENK